MNNNIHFKHLKDCKQGLQTVLILLGFFHLKNKFFFIGLNHIFIYLYLHCIYGYGLLNVYKNNVKACKNFKYPKNPKDAKIDYIF